MTIETKLIPIQTTAGEFKVWTEKHGQNDKIKILMLHGGPGCNHYYLKACDKPFAKLGVEYFYYDQLGSTNSPTGYPDDSKLDHLWELDRFVDEVEKVRKALGLNKDNFVLYGQSWGGLLAQEYALKHGENLKALIVSNMMSSSPAYGAYSKNLLAKLDDQVAAKRIKELDLNQNKTAEENEELEQLTLQHYYRAYVIQKPMEQWPEEVTKAFTGLNQAIYIPMQGPSELGVRGKLANWDRTGDISKITVPTLFIGAEHDTMDPRHLEAMAKKLPKGQSYICKKGSHLAMWDDSESYFKGIGQFIRGLT
ncbi:MAG: proline iminopeptidase-family hydrolase [Parashewanella sp.]